MATISFDVTSYTIWLGPSLGFSTLPIAYPALIICWGEKNFRCQFRFINDNLLPDSQYDPDTHVANIFVSAAQYPWYVDLLRNEGPIECSIDTNTPKRSVLKTGQEPVGEGEAVIRP